MAQDCPQGQKCAAVAVGGSSSWNAARCVDIMGDGAPGDPCTAIGGGLTGQDDCGFGAMCWSVDEDNHGVCFGLCTGTWEEPVCPASNDCVINGDGTLNLCFPWCDPLLQDCTGGEVCIPSGLTFTCVVDASGDEGQFNDPCEFANTCDPGLVCVPSLSASSACDPQKSDCCQPFCELPEAPCPNPDQQCVPWYAPGMEMPGFETVGVCAIPR